MTQGYGQGHDQWGQPSPQQQPQWGQDAQPAPAPPQWGQPSPAPAAEGYPGSAAYPGAPGGGAPLHDGVHWKRVKLIGLIILIAAALSLLVRLGSDALGFLLAEDLADQARGQELGGAALGGGALSLLLLGAGQLLNLALFVLGVLAAIMGRAKARWGGVLVAAMVPVGVGLYWLVTIIAVIIAMATGLADSSTGEITAGVYRLQYGLDAVRNLLVIAVIALGGFLVHSTAAKKLAA